MRVQFSDTVLNSNEVEWSGGAGVMYAEAGNFDSTTLQLQARHPESTTWWNVPSATAGNTTSLVSFNLPAGLRLRMALTGGSSPTPTVIGVLA